MTDLPGRTHPTSPVLIERLWFSSFQKVTVQELTKELLERKREV